MSSAQLNKLHPLLCSIVRTRQITKNWKKSRQCPRQHWSRCSPCLVTCRCRMEFSRAGQAHRLRKEPAKSSTFVSFWDQQQILSSRLWSIPPPNRSPNISPATYFGARRPVYAGNMADPPAQVDGNYGMGQRPE